MEQTLSPLQFKPFPIDGLPSLGHDPGWVDDYAVSRDWAKAFFIRFAQATEGTALSFSSVKEFDPGTVATMHCELFSYAWLALAKLGDDQTSNSKALRIESVISMVQTAPFTEMQFKEDYRGGAAPDWHSIEVSQAADQLMQAVAPMYPLRPMLKKALIQTIQHLNFSPVYPVFREQITAFLKLKVAYLANYDHHTPL